MVESWMNELHPKRILGYVVRAQSAADITCTKILPEKRIDQMLAYYHNKVGGGFRAKQVGEGQEDPEADIKYVESTIKTYEYRLGGYVTERAMRFMLNNPVGELTSDLTMAIQLAKENDFISTLEGKAYTSNSVGGGSGKYWDSVGGSDSGTYMNRYTGYEMRIRKAITDGIKNIQDNTFGHVKPDTLIVPSWVIPIWEQNIRSLWDGRETISQYGIGRICGLDVLPTFSWSLDLDANTSAAMLDDDAYVLKRGMDTGCIAVSEPFESRTWPVKERRAHHIQCFETFDTVLWRTRNIAKLDNIKA